MIDFEAEYETMCARTEEGRAADIEARREKPLPLFLGTGRKLEEKFKNGEIEDFGGSHSGLSPL